jgi:hypothetical protein
LTVVIKGVKLGYMDVNLASFAGVPVFICHVDPPFPPSGSMGSVGRVGLDLESLIYMYCLHIPRTTPYLKWKFGIENIGERQPPLVNTAASPPTPDKTRITQRSTQTTTDGDCTPCIVQNVFRIEFGEPLDIQCQMQGVKTDTTKPTINAA